MDITPETKISYAVICERLKEPSMYCNTYDEAVEWAKFDQPAYRPFYIVKRTETFEICGKVN